MREIKRLFYIVVLIVLVTGGGEALLLGSYEILEGAAVIIGLPFVCLWLIPRMIAGYGDPPTAEEQRLAKEIGKQVAKRRDY